jgi:hypothetical protein
MRQKYRYGTREWARTYRRDRASVESTNKTLKTEFNLNDTGARRLRGLAAQQFYFTMMIVAANFKRIVEFLHRHHKTQKAAEARKHATKTSEADQKAEETVTAQRRRDRLGLSRYRRNAPPLDYVDPPPPGPVSIG